jgi:hypothetical protein
MPPRIATIKYYSSFPKCHFPFIFSVCNATRSICTCSTSCFKIRLAPGLYNDRTFQVPILKHCQDHLCLVLSFLPRLILCVFVTSIFHRGRSLACHPTPNLEDQSAYLILGYHLCPVWQGRPYQ